MCPLITQVLGRGPREVVVGEAGILLPDHQGLGQALGGLLIVFHSDLQKVFRRVHVAGLRPLSLARSVERLALGFREYSHHSLTNKSGSPHLSCLYKHDGLC